LSIEGDVSRWSIRPRHVTSQYSGDPEDALSAAALAFQQCQQHYDGMAKSITVRDVPDETSEELAARAALTGRSLQEYLRAQLVKLAASPDPEVLLARVRARKAATRSSMTVDQILEHRDTGRP